MMIFSANGSIKHLWPERKLALPAAAAAAAATKTNLTLTRPKANPDGQIAVCWTGQRRERYVLWR